MKVDIISTPKEKMEVGDLLAFLTDPKCFGLVLTTSNTKYPIGVFDLEKNKYSNEYESIEALNRSTMYELFAKSSDLILSIKK